jgi:predicted metal-binding protein
MQTMAAAIEKQEGYYPGSIAYTDNNPGNLMYAGQPGATAGPGGFAVFDSYADGEQALYNQLNLYAQGTCGACNGQPLTIEQMTAIYAPAAQAGNNPTVYAQNLAAALGVDPNTPLADAFGGGDISISPDTPSSLTATVSIAGVDVPIWGLVAGAGALLLLMAAAS